MTTTADPLLIAISDDEMSDAGIRSDLLPKKGRAPKSYKEPEPDEFEEDEEVRPDATGAEDDDDDEDGEDLDEDEFVVEKIFSHYIAEDVRCPQWPLPTTFGCAHADPADRACQGSRSSGRAGRTRKTVLGNLKKT